jgi:hypothetical protein
MAEDIALYHEGLKEVAYVRTAEQAEILKETGWTRATKAQVEKAQTAAEKEAEA